MQSQDRSTLPPFLESTQLRNKYFFNITWSNSQKASSASLQVLLAELAFSVRRIRQPHASQSEGTIDGKYARHRFKLEPASEA